MGSCPLAIFVRMVRTRLAGIGLAVLVLAGCQSGPGGEQTLVDRATLTIQELMTQNVSQDPKTLLRRAKGVLICPRVFKAGFFFGGEGGSCVLLARSGNGTWSYPTFYDIGSGSFGFQFGVQDSQLMLLVMTNRGLSALMDSQVQLGGSASLAIASIGGGVEGATTAAVGADIVAFAEARGLFGGVSLQGSVMSARIDENQAYYGQPLVARQIVVQMQGVNPGADPLREVLTRYGSPEGSYVPPGGAPRGVYPPMPDQSAYPPGSGPGQPPPPAQQAYPPGYQPPPGQPAYPPGGYQPPPGGYQSPPAPTPGYSPPAAPRTAAPGNAPPPPQPPSGYQPPPGQYTYPPTSGSGPIQEQSLPPPGR
jgi:lipid-binding SYLF domain-containing protein